MAAPEIQRYEFGPEVAPYRIDTGERLLHRGDELIPLPPKFIDTLLVLIENAPRMVDKSYLMKAVWPDTFVAEGALTRNISQLRKTLEDTGVEARYIETIPRRGYRFVASVRTGGVEQQQPTSARANPSGTVESQREGREARRRRRRRVFWAAMAGVPLLAIVVALANYIISGSDPPVPKPPAHTLAVLPFRNVESDPSQDYFAAGMTAALITGLAKLGNLRVISLVPYAGEKGESTGPIKVPDPSVTRVLTGTLLRSGERVRVDAQLIDPKTHAVAWANSYERDTRDVLALESAVAEAIASEIQVNITAEDKRRLQQNRRINPAALDAYLRGRYFWNRRTEEGLKRSIEYFQQAIAADPAYAQAYSGLADSYSLLATIEIAGMPPNTAMPLAKAAALKALEMDPSLPEGHVSLAYVKLSYDWDLRGAREEFARALALNPASATARHWYSHYFIAAGELGKATEQMQAALQLEPLSPSINAGIGWCYYYAQQYDKAIKAYGDLVDVDPSFPLAHQLLGMAYQQKGMYSEAIQEFKRAVSLSGNGPAAVAGLASAYAAAGRAGDARQELSRLEEISHHKYVPALLFASIYQSLGDTGKMFDWGWKAVGERTDYLMYLRLEPQASKLISNPQFIKALGVLHP